MYAATPKPMLSATERMQMILAAPPATLAKVDAILQGVEGTTQKPEADCTLATYTQVAKKLKLSRPSVYRLCKMGRLEVVPICGVNRIRMQSVLDLIGGKRPIDADAAKAVATAAKVKCERRARTIAANKGAKQ